MKLLFDQNLSFRLVERLRDLFPECQHVKVAGLEQADDAHIWQYARDHDFVIVTQDSDFEHRARLLGHPPKLLWVRCGNSSTEYVERIIRASCEAILAFHADPDVSCLEVF